MTPEHFQLGVWLSLAGLVLILLDWLILSKSYSRSLRYLGLSLVLIIGGGVVYLVGFMPAPIRILTIPAAEHYEIGSTIHGIPWQAGYSEIELTLANDTGIEYRNIDAYFRTDLIIAASSLHPGIEACSVTVEQPGFKISGIFAKGKDNTGKDVTIMSDDHHAMGTFNRIYCSNLPAHSSVTVTFALIPPPGTGLNIPLSPSDPVPAKWSAIGIDYIGGNKTRRILKINCESSPCYQLPEATTIGFIQ